MSKREVCAVTHVAGEVVKAQHHDEDHRCHRVLGGQQGQPAGQRASHREFYFLCCPLFAVAQGPETSPSSLSTFTSSPDSPRAVKLS